MPSTIDVRSFGSMRRQSYDVPAHPAWFDRADRRESEKGSSRPLGKRTR